MVVTLLWLLRGPTGPLDGALSTAGFVDVVAAILEATYLAPLVLGGEAQLLEERAVVMPPVLQRMTEVRPVLIAHGGMVNPGVGESKPSARKEEALASSAWRQWRTPQAGERLTKTLGQ
jgi:hypothetical protein